MDSIDIQEIPDIVLQFQDESLMGCEDFIPTTTTIQLDNAVEVMAIIELPDGMLDTVSIAENMNTYTISSAGQYRLLSAIVNGCPLDLADTLDVLIGGITASPEVIGDPCATDEVYTIRLNAMSDALPLMYTWSTGDEISADTFSLSAGLYFVTVTDTLGCIYLDTFDLVGGNLPNVEIIQPDCGRDTGCISVDEPLLYEYQILPDMSMRDDWPVKLGSGTSTVIISDETGCRDTIQVNILPKDSVEVIIKALDTILAGEVVMLDPMLNIREDIISSILWTPDTWLNDPNILRPIASPLERIIYTLTVTDSSGCSGTASTEILVVTASFIYIPTAFSPNNDGINDVIYPLSDASFSEVIRFEIYNRWGGKVFGRESFPLNTESLGWDGTANGEALNPGVFTYYIEALRVDNSLYTAKGNIHLIR